MAGSSDHRQITWCLGAAVVLALAAACTTSPVRVESDPPLPKAMARELADLVSAQDLLVQPDVHEELMRLTLAADQDRVNDYLRAMGYYDATLSLRRDDVEATGRIVVDVQPGPRYQLEDFTARWPKGYEGPRPAALPPERDATSPAILATRAAIIRRLREQGYPAPATTNLNIVVDHATRTVRVAFDVQPGTNAVFGDTRVEGLRRLRPSYVRKALPWKQGDRYDIRKVELLEQRLAASGLFSSIQTRRDNEVLVPGSDYPLAIALRERKARTMQVGVGYKTDTGGEIAAQWQHRNLLGGGENLVVRGRVTEESNEAELRLTVPFFRRSDQTWGSSLRYEEENSDAYDSETIQAESWISRQVNRRLTLRSGLALQYLDETQNEETELYYLVSLPSSATWDDTNDRLDATRGYRLLWQTQPFQSIDDASLFFWRNLGAGQGFQPLNRHKTWLVALRVSAGSLSAASLDAIPADTRFYAGGGQSVRGYAYQALSPRDEEGEIIGGRSLFESSLELRGRLTSTIGLVAFIDGGAAYPETYPDFSETYRWGAGAGFRYFTPVGPLRFDAGVPLNRRDGIDDSWQFYISIGQAF